MTYKKDFSKISDIVPGVRLEWHTEMVDVIAANFIAVDEKANAKLRAYFDSNGIPYDDGLPNKNAPHQTTVTDLKKLVDAGIDISSITTGALLMREAEKKGHEISDLFPGAVITYQRGDQHHAAQIVISFPQAAEGADKAEARAQYTMLKAAIEGMDVAYEDISSAQRPCTLAITEGTARSGFGSNMHTFYQKAPFYLDPAFQKTLTIASHARFVHSDSPEQGRTI